MLYFSTPCPCSCSIYSKVHVNLLLLQALGDYTRLINDFSILPSDVKEGKVGSYWYHEDTQAFFDEVDHYNMIKAMCRLSCSVCDNVEGQPNDGPKRRAKFRNIEQLKGHLFHQHKLVMCSLCLEGRKVKFLYLTSYMISGLLIKKKNYDFGFLKKPSFSYMVCMGTSLASFV